MSFLLPNQQRHGTEVTFHQTAVNSVTGCAGWTHLNGGRVVIGRASVAMTTVPVGRRSTSLSLHRKLEHRPRLTTQHAIAHILVGTTPKVYGIAHRLVFYLDVSRLPLPKNRTYPCSRPSVSIFRPVKYSPRRQSGWELAEYGGKDLWKTPTRPYEVRSCALCV